MKISPQDIKATFYPVGKGDLVASLSIQIGQYKIRGFTIRKSKFDDKYFISPPHRKLSGGKWAKLFWANKEDWEELEKLILEKFI
jgi:hypothetical protein